MTEHYLKNTSHEVSFSDSGIHPDGITGMIFAMEGIRNTVVLLNGPMGCRFYHSTTSQFLSIRPLLYLPSERGEKVPVDYNFLNNWFFRQQRVPCTYLDGHDYVYGTTEKVREGLLYMKEHIAFDVMAVINSPGASLIGDRLLEIVHELLPDKTCVLLESPGFSVDYDYGYEHACLQLLQQNAGKMAGNAAGKEKTQRNTENAENAAKKKVNVIGLSIWDRYFEGDREEIQRLLRLCGMETGCFLAADCSLEEIRHLPDADLNIVLNAQRGLSIAEYLEKEYGTPYYLPEGMPVGFEATEHFLSDICKAVGGKDAGADCSEAIEESRKARAYAWYKIDGVYQMSGLPKGALFAVKGSFAQVFSYSAFFMEYLGMLPDALCVEGEMQPSMKKKLRALLEAYHCENAMEKPFDTTSAELVFSDANTIAALMMRSTPKQESAGGRKDEAPKLQHIPFCGIEISLPGMGYTDLVRKTHLGIRGAMLLTEQVLNGLMTRL